MPLDDPLNAAVVSIMVRNTGQRTGSTMVQTYIGKLPASIAAPPKQLAGFAKVTLKPSEIIYVEMTISRSMIADDDDTHPWVTPKADITVYVGSSADDDGLMGTLHYVTEKLNLYRVEIYSGGKRCRVEKSHKREASSGVSVVIVQNPAWDISTMNSTMLGM